MEEALIQYRNVEIHQQELCVLSDVNLELRKGEFVYLIGKVGSGKTSLLKTLYGELDVIDGEAEVLGYNMRSIKRKHIPQLRRKLGIVFQDFQLLTDRTVYNNLEFVLRATGWKNKREIQERIEEVLDLVGMSNKGYKLPNELSGGEQQRIVIARAVLNSPAIILADEPTGNLDPESTMDLAQEILRLKEKGVAVLIVDHRLYWLKGVADRVCVMEKGRIVQEGTFDDLSDEVRARYGLRKVDVEDKRHELPPLSDGKETVMKISDLSFAYPRKDKIFNGTDLELRKGITGLFGPNGTGKTTLARILTGLNKPTQGTLEIRGKKVKPQECLRHVAVVLQNADHQLYMRTVFDELLTSLEAAGCRGGKQAAEELMQLFDLTELRDRHPHSLSGGQQQRLVIACAFAKKPDVIILDEPTSGLDGANLHRIAGALRQLSDEGKAVLVITHDLELVDMVCDSAIRLPLQKTNLSSTI